MKKYCVMALAAIAIAGFTAQAVADGRGTRGRGDYSGHRDYDRHRDYGGHGHRSNFSFYLGGPGYWSPSYFGPSYYGPSYYGPSPYYYAPRAVIIQPDPPVYIQRAPDVVIQAPAAVAPATAWYYCPSPAGYYPTIQNCTQPWVSVDPRTVAPAPAQ